MKMKQDDIKHHLTDDLMMAYSAGTLPEAYSLAVAAHISMCDESRAKMHAYDAVGGSLVENSEVADMSANSLEETLGMIDAMDTVEKPMAPKPGVLPAPVQDYVGGDLDAVKWRPVGMGVKQAILPIEGNANARLLYIPAGGAMPDHGHNGMELTVVFQGAYSDGKNRFGPGDIEVAGEEDDHTPVADIGEDCICLTVTDAPLKFNSWLPRVMQRFFRI
ncbi:MAG: ChrR family anti-sigma-E factor [Pseudomonadota bacterium]